MSIDLQSLIEALTRIADISGRAPTVTGLLECNAISRSALLCCGHPADVDRRHISETSVAVSAGWIGL